MLGSSPAAAAAAALDREIGKETQRMHLDAEKFENHVPAPEGEDRFHGALLPARDLGRPPDVLDGVVVLGQVEGD